MVPILSYLKRVFKEAIIDLIPRENIVMLHDYSSDGITFLMRIECTEKNLKELDDTIFEIVMYVKNEIHDTHPSINTSFTTGYTFIDKKYYSLDEAISKAHQQAVAIAEKKIEYEEHSLLETINQIIAERNIRLISTAYF